MPLVAPPGPPLRHNRHDNEALGAKLFGPVLQAIHQEEA
jgi:hypothetical protein